jgi:hypothetical protein
MKKQLLFASAILFTGMLGAQVSKKVGKIPANIANKSELRAKTIHGNEQVPSSSNSSSSIKPSITPINNAKIATVTSATIGSTYYDLQSNSSVGDRIVVNADGTIATVWTISQDNSGSGSFPDRGTGYNYFNGSNWGPAPTARIEAARVGWGNVVNTRSGKELILSHNTSVNLLDLTSRATKGAGSFSESTTAVPSATAGGNFWPRMVSAGDTVYAISVTQQTATAGASTYQGLNGAVCFSRSLNAGATWDIVNVIPAGLDATRFLGHGGDAYAIAAKGNTVVVVAGDSGKDLVLSKSTDAGATWTYKVVMKFPLPLWDYTTTTSDINGDNIADTVSTNDGNFSVGLDNNNQAYVFYGNMRILNDAPSATGFSYFPGTDGLMMWKESFQANTDTGGILVAQIQDLYEQGVIYFPTPAVSGDLSFGRWGCSLTSYPSVAFDASNIMYLTYSSVVDSLMAITTNSTTKLVRHVYIIKSTDGGIHWTTPCDLVGLPNGIPYEGMFASVAKRVDGNVHLIYQRDLAPGNGIPPTSGTNPDQTDNTAPNTTGNDIIYVKVPVGDIGTCVVANGINELSSTVSNLNFYPNPASSNGTIEVSLVENAKMDVVVMNSVGQTVYTSSFEGTSGNNKIDINLSNLSAGLYFYQVKIANSKSVTKKFVVQK